MKTCKVCLRPYKHLSRGRCGPCRIYWCRHQAERPTDVVVKSARKWTPEEEEVVRLAYAGPFIDIAALARQLHRTPAAVALRASRRGWCIPGRKWGQQRRDQKAVQTRQQIADGLRVVPTFAGHTHSPGARKRIGEAMRGRKQPPRTEAHRLAISRATTLRLTTGGNVYSSARRGRREDLGGLFLRSSWEANYARYLNWLVAQQVVQSWAYESKTFWFERIRRGVRSYTPDFLVTRPDGSHYWVEVKGYLDPKSKTKLARMKRYYPDEVVHLVGPTEYRALVRQFAGLVPHWESGREKAA